MRKIVAVLMALMTAACASAPKSDTSQPPQASETKASAVTDAQVSAAETDTEPEYRQILGEESNFIKAYKNDIITVEGHCDERRSSEYNLSLGKRRGNAARKSPGLIGVSVTQVETLSPGEEKPRLQCREEKCWKENRRDDFIHQLN